MDESAIAVRRLARRQHWLVTAEQARRHGLLPGQIRTLLRAGAWRSMLHGVYLVDADLASVVDESMWWRAALLAHGSEALLVGPTAVKAHGGAGVPLTHTTVEVTATSTKSRVVRSLADAPYGAGVDGPLVVFRQTTISETEVVNVQGMRVAAPARAVVDACLDLDRVHALCVLDSALFLRLVDPGELDETVLAARRRPGCRQLREVALLADPRAQSPLETRIRLICIDGGVPPDELQYPVRTSDGHLVALGDLAWLKRRQRPLIAEADGVGPHERPEAVFRDRRRGNELAGRACDTVRFTWQDSMRSTYVLHVVRQALAAS